MDRVYRTVSLTRSDSLADIETDLLLFGGFRITVVKSAVEFALITEDSLICNEGPMKLNKKQVSYSIILFFFIIGTLELTLSLLAVVSPRIDTIVGTSDAIPYTVPDEHLGDRPNPAYPGHDRLGFRNPKVPAKAQVIALGDSQTYGTGVESEDAWPRQLESMTGKIVYGMAFGGYGPTHSLILWDEAVALEPQIVIEAFYAGNDLFDSFNHVYNQGQLPALKSADPQSQHRVREAEHSKPIEKHVSQMYQMGATTVALSLPRRLLSQYSKLYGLLRRMRSEFTRLVSKPNQTAQEEWESAKAFAKACPAYCEVFSHGQFKTIFTTAYRLAALNLGDPRIAEGLQISLRAIQRLHDAAIARNIRFLVLLIPTKETVFRKLWQNPSRTYSNLTEDEERFWRTTKDFLEENGIEYLDALPALQAQLAAGIQPYKVSQDGHPNKHGHRVIAELVTAYLKLPRAAQVEESVADDRQ